VFRSYGFDEALDLETSLADSMRLEPMNLGCGNRTIRQPNHCVTLSLSPVSSTVQLHQSAEDANAATFRNRLNIADLAEDLEAHCQVCLLTRSVSTSRFSGLTPYEFFGIAFWIGYRIHPLYRAFGMAGTGYLNLGILAFAIWGIVR